MNVSRIAKNPVEREPRAEPSRELTYTEKDEGYYRRIAEEEAGKLEDLIVLLTSGTTSEGTPVPYSKEYQERTTYRTAELFQTAFPDEDLRDEVFLGLGSRFPNSDGPHVSGYTFGNVYRYLGTEYDGGAVGPGYQWFEQGEYKLGDFMEVFEEVTAVEAVPSVMEAIGKMLEAEHGQSPAEMFPNLDKAFFFGEPVWPDIREDVADQWGLPVANTREVWASTEGNSMAIATDSSRELVPLTNHYVLELIPEGEEEPVNILEVDEEVEGDILITDFDRDLIANPGSAENYFERYIQGDKVRIVPNDPLNLIEILGRDAYSVNVRGAIVHHDAIAHARGEMTGGESVSDVKAGHVRENGNDFFDIYVPEVERATLWDVDEEGSRYAGEIVDGSDVEPIDGSEVDGDIQKFVDTILQASSPAEEAGRIGAIDRIRVLPREDFPGDEEGLKSGIMFDQS